MEKYKEISLRIGLKEKTVLVYYLFLDFFNGFFSKIKCHVFHANSCQTKIRTI